MRGTAWAASAAAVAVALAAGCGTVHYSGRAGHRNGTAGGGSGQAGTAATTQGPATITRQQAERLARDLLSRTPLPRGARQTSGAPVPALGQPSGVAAGTPSVSVHALWTVAQPVDEVYAFLTRHVPARMALSGTGQAGGGAGQAGVGQAGGGTGTVVPVTGKPAGMPQGVRPRPGKAARGVSVQPVKVATVYEEFVSYEASPLPAGVSSAVLSMSVVSAGNGVSKLRADAQVIWYPPRSAAEHIPAGMHAVTITASTFLPRPGTITRTFTSPAVVARLAGMLNGAHASDLGLVPCPLAVGSYRLAFATSPRAAPYLVATDPGCPGIAVSVAGRAQPSLQVPAALQTTLATLMPVHGLPGPGGASPPILTPVSPPVVAPGPPTCVKPPRGVWSVPGFRESRDAGTLPTPCPALSPVA